MDPLPPASLSEQGENDFQKWGRKTAEIRHLPSKLTSEKRGNSFFRKMGKYYLLFTTAFEPLTMQYDRINEVSEYIRTLDKTEQNSLKETIRLISGFESTLALEVLASVDFIRHTNPGISLDDTIKAIHNWSDRKTKLFKNEYIQIAYDHLDTFYSDSRELF